MARRAVTRTELDSALELVRPGTPLTAVQTRDTVRTTLRWFAQIHEGHTVEVRVPPHAAVQAVDGPRHTRGTPPNVIEMSPAVWLDLVAGRLTWEEAVEGGKLHASGIRADLAGLLPLTGREPLPGQESLPGREPW
ncbi:hypothetical protein D1871_15565 [Nakamurella silvestris]|nr:hypothetical protein D1871_15565 [Nakamurella silvestris]